MINYISESEKQYIITGIYHNIRYDGRGAFDFRSISIEDQILPHLNGSSRVLVGSTTDITCSLKFEIGECSANFDYNDMLDVNIDISPSCNLKIDERRIQDYSCNLAEIMKKIIIESAALDFNDLLIIPAKFCWFIHIDIMVFTFDGSIIDVSSIAILNALNSVKLPKITKLVEESGDFDDFEISGDLSESLPLKFDEFPLFMTITKIGASLILDASSSEIACSTGQLLIAVNKRGFISGVNKLLSGTFSLEEMTDAINISLKASKEIFLKLEMLFQTNAPSVFPEIPPQRVGFLA